MAHTNTGEQQQQSLYLEVNSSTDEDAAFPLHTSISLFLLSYCECKCFKVHLVTAKPAASSLSLRGHIPSSLDICDIQPGNVPVLVKGCRLPAVLDETGRYCRAGLAVVLRHIINRTMEIDPSRKDVLALLGFKKTCLKACAEVSQWTRLCELGIPSAVEEHLQNPADPSLHLPSTILHLEKKLGEPVKVHNDDKIRRQKLQQQKQQQKKKASKSLEGQENPDSDPQSPQGSGGGLELRTALAKLSVDAVPPPATRESSEIRRVRTAELPPLEHVFAEGLYFTLTDVVLLPCIYHYLRSIQTLSPGTVSMLPLLLRWYSRVQEVPGVLTAAAACGMLLPMDPRAPAWTPGPPRSPSSPPAPEAVTGATLTDVVEQDGVEGGTTTTAVPQEHFIGGPRPTMTKLKDHGIEAVFSPHPNPDWTLAWNDLPAAVNPTEGKMSDVRAIRKRQQLNNLVAMVIELARTGQTVVDFCSGGGHVGIVLAHTLPDCQVILIENKEESLVRAKSRSAELGLANIGFIQANLDYFTGPFDIGLNKRTLGDLSAQFMFQVALHACGVATDMVLGHCIQAGASFVVSPCCYGFIQNTVKFSFPRSKRFQESLSYKEHMILCRFADQTAVQLPPERRIIGKQCMGLVDLDRSWAAEAYGYSVQVMTMVPESCSPKNGMLVGRARENAPARESAGMYC